MALCNNLGACRWYRVVAIADNSTNAASNGGFATSNAQLTLAGPDWPYMTTNNVSNGPIKNGDKLIALGQEVVGVYTTTIDLDTDATWKN